MCACIQVETCKDESLRKRVIGYYKYLVSVCLCVHTVTNQHSHVSMLIVFNDEKQHKSFHGLFQWMRSKGNCNRSLFDELPRSFQAEVSLGTYKTMMEQASGQICIWLAPHVSGEPVQDGEESHMPMFARAANCQAP